MASYGIAEAKNALPGLVRLALAGEEVVITRHGQPLVELKAVRPARKPDPAAATHALEARMKDLPMIGVPSQRFYDWLYDDESE